jgi:hypothetical protein
MALTRPSPLCYDNLDLAGPTTSCQLYLRKGETYK